MPADGKMSSIGGQQSLWCVMSLIKSVTVLGDSWCSLLVACVLKKHIKNLEVQVINRPASQSNALWIEHGLQTLLQYLDVSLNVLMKSCAGTFHLAHCISKGASCSPFYWSAHEYGITTEVVDFHQVYERFSRADMSYDDFCLAAQLAKKSKVLPFSELSGLNNPGIHLDALCFMQLLERYAEHLQIKVTSDYSGAMDELCEAEFVIDTCQRGRSFFSTANKKGENWNQYFAHQYRASCFSSATISSFPATHLQINPSYIINSVPLRTGTFYYCYGDQQNAVDVVRAIDDTEYYEKQLDFGVLHAPWDGKALVLGAAASNPGDMLVSTLDRVMCELRVLLDLWPSLPLQQSLMNEYNRLSNDLYYSIRDFHLLAQWLSVFNGDMDQIDRLPQKLIREVEVFIASTRLPHRDNRFPHVSHWNTLLMGLKTWSTSQVSTQLEISDTNLFFHQLAHSIQAKVTSAPSQVSVLDFSHNH